MSYESEMKALLHNCIGMFSKEVTSIYWENYQNENLKSNLENLYMRFA